MERRPGFFPGRPVGERLFGRRITEIAKRVQGGHLEEGHAQAGSLASRNETANKQTTAKEELEEIRQRNLDRLLNRRMPPQVAEELSELIQQAMEREIDGRDMHSLLSQFLHAKFRQSGELNERRINGWVTAIMRVTHPDYSGHG